jgi:thymidine phosphorylase
LLAAKKAKMSEVEDMEEDEEKAMKMKMVKSSESVDASVLDTAEVAEEVNLGVGGDSESAVEATRAALVEFVCSRLGKTL